MILWFGWYGFNCGSTIDVIIIKDGILDTKNIEVIGRSGMITTIAGCAGGIGSSAIHYYLERKTNNRYSIAALCNGILVGLVSITAGCNNFDPYAGLVSGLLGSMMY